MPDPKKYTVGWICAISIEYAAALAFLDEEHDKPEIVSQDNNTYTFGRIGHHNVIVAVLPAGGYGTTSAAVVARDMMHSFPNVRIGLMVGIGGGAPSARHDIRLGDIVVSRPNGVTAAVWQYDLGKTIQDQKFYHTGSLNRPPAVLLAAMTHLEAIYEHEGHRIKDKVEHALGKQSEWFQNRFRRPDGASDRLFKSEFVHPTESGSSCEVTCSSNTSNIVVRKQRDEDKDDLAVHYGLIASANQVMKDASVRDTLSREQGVLCFEMEAAGLMNHFPCLVIRGICDYADSHKNKQWQGYAAMTAAAYTKDLLRHIAPKGVELEKKLVMKIADVLKVDEKVDRVVDWLSPPDPSTIFNNSVAQCHPETGRWFLRSSSFNDWMMGETRFLWLHGIPGCGKTILSSTIIKELKDRKRNDQIVLYYYFTFSKKSMQEYEGMIRSLIAQMVAAGIEGSRKHVGQLYVACANGTQQPSLQKLLDNLRDMLRGAGHIYIIVDALDECENRGSGLFHGIRELQLIPETRLLVTGRMEQDIKASIGAWAQEQDMISIQSSLVADDIRAYIHTRVREHAGLRRWKTRPRIQEEIEAALFEKADGMFRWVSCQLDALERCLDVYTLRQALATLPRTLDETYARILQRIPQEHQRNACRILQFITYSHHPLSIQELIDVIAVNPEQCPGFIQDHRMPVPEEILLYCASLVTRVDDSSGFSTRIRLAHFSVQEYLTSDRLHGDMAKPLEEPSAKATIVKVCVSYLLAAGCGSDRDFPLAEFAAATWPLYAAETYLRDDAIHKLIVELLRSDVPRLSHLVSRPRGILDPSQSSIGSAALLGLTRVVRDLLDGDASAKYSDEELYDVLCYSARYGHEDIVRHLFDQSMKLSAHNSGQRALEEASSFGHKRIVRLLLANGANIEAAGKWNKTALHFAARNGHVGTVSLLLSEGANTEAVDDHRQTALHSAARHGHVDTVSLLLSKGADHSIADIYGETPLHYAAERNHLSTTKILVSRGASLDVVDIHGRKPLECAQRPLSGPFEGKACVETIEYFTVVMVAAKADSNSGGFHDVRLFVRYLFLFAVAAFKSGMKLRRRNDP